MQHVDVLTFGRTSNDYDDKNSLCDRCSNFDGHDIFFLIFLITLIGSFIWIGLALMGGLGRDGDVHDPPCRRRNDHNEMDRGVVVDADRFTVVHLDG